MNHLSNCGNVHDISAYRCNIDTKLIAKQKLFWKVQIANNGKNYFVVSKFIFNMQKLT